MLLDNKQYKNQLSGVITESLVPWNELKEKSVLITGSTGMIGSALTDVLIYGNEILGFNVSIYALARKKEKLLDRFGRFAKRDYFHIVEADVTEKFAFNISIDYIIHAASNANPYMYAHYPVDTLLGNVLGTNNCLKYASEHGTKRVLYISSGEMYGQPDESLEKGFYESFCGKVDYSDPRSCYPAGKRAAEVLCQSYISQYGQEAVIVRPCHTYGPTQTASDNRAISQFINKTIAGENIVLKSDGSLVRTHCYVLDAVQAIFFVLLKGENGAAYNIADNLSDASVRELAEQIGAEKGKKVLFDIPDSTEKKGFSRVTKAVLDGEKLRNLGWKPIWHLKDGLQSTIEILEREIEEK